MSELFLELKMFAFAVFVIPFIFVSSCFADCLGLVEREPLPYEVAMESLGEYTVSENIIAELAGQDFIEYTKYYYDSVNLPNDIFIEIDEQSYPTVINALDSFESWTGQYGQYDFERDIITYGDYYFEYDKGNMDYYLELLIYDTESNTLHFFRNKT